MITAITVVAAAAAAAIVGEEITAGINNVIRRVSYITVYSCFSGCVQVHLRWMFMWLSVFVYTPTRMLVYHGSIEHQTTRWIDTTVVTRILRMRAHAHRGSKMQSIETTVRHSKSDFYSVSLVRGSLSIGSAEARICDVLVEVKPISPKYESC